MCDPGTLGVMIAGATAAGGAGYANTAQKNAGIRRQQQLNALFESMQDTARQRFMSDTEAAIAQGRTAVRNAVFGGANPTQMLPRVSALQSQFMARNVDPAVARITAGNAPAAAGVRPEVQLTKRDLARQLAGTAADVRRGLVGRATVNAFQQDTRDRSAELERAVNEVGLQNARVRDAAGLYRGIMSQRPPQVTIGDDPMLTGIQSFGTAVAGNAASNLFPGGNRTVTPQVSGTVQRAPGSFGPGYYGSGTPF